MNRNSYQACSDHKFFHRIRRPNWTNLLRLWNYRQSIVVQFLPILLVYASNQFNCFIKKIEKRIKIRLLLVIFLLTGEFGSSVMIHHIVVMDSCDDSSQLVTSKSWAWIELTAKEPNSIFEIFPISKFLLNEKLKFRNDFELSNCDEDGGIATCDSDLSHIEYRVIQI